MRKHRSLGEMISTATFWDVGYLYFYTAWNCSTRDNGCAPMSGFCGFVCILGGFRFTIANLIIKWRNS